MTTTVPGTSTILRGFQRRIFASVWITYFAYYLCRYNMPVAQNRLGELFKWSAADTGMILTALTLLYAVGQFVNGQLADRFGSRRIVSLGALGSVVMNLAVFALLMAVDPETCRREMVLWGLIVFWGANGFFQAMGWSPMVRLMAHWFPVEGRGKVMGLVGTCYQFGGAVASVLAIFLTGYYATALGGDWRSAFLVPAVLFALVGLVFYLAVWNRPEDVGLPPVGETPAPGETSKSTLAGNVLQTLRNPYLWIVAGAFFMLDVNRYGFVNWLPKYLKAVYGAGEDASIGRELAQMVSIGILPLGGAAGALVAGWATDRYFGGRRAPVIVILLALLGLFSLLFPYLDPKNTPLVVAVLAAIGFCTYGPHLLMVGHAAQDFGRKSGAAGAAGFIDSLGYVGASLAGWGAGVMIDGFGYQTTFLTFGWAGLAGAAMAALIWKVGPHTHGAIPSK
ncbi:MAG: MFS transporter [Pirellulales bacterium]|nr:MFS transporter [Pirellulales bacterium]